MVDKNSLMSLIEFQSKSLSLLWRGNRDGFQVNDFHKLCDGKPNTLTVVKSISGFIFGGYTAVPWTSSFGGWQKDLKAFLFTFKNASNLPLKLKINSAGKKAVYHNIKYGPTFGAGFDLHLSGTSNTPTSGSYIYSANYDLPNEQSGELGAKFIHGGSTINFQTVEVEVFQVTTEIMTEQDLPSHNANSEHNHNPNLTTSIQTEKVEIFTYLLTKTHK